MGIREQALWVHLEESAKQEDPKTYTKYLTEVEEICTFGVNRAKMINITFPMFTLHDETHICNVLRIMAELLGDRLEELTRDETAMLILAACCHDIGMSVSNAERQALVRGDQLRQYLDRHESAYNKAYAKGGSTPELSDALLRDFLRTIHHERVKELLCKQYPHWPKALVGKVNCKDLILVCQSHGEDISAVEGLASNGVDLRFCAVLLRLADILDFDTSRSPGAVYEYCGFDRKDDPEAVISRGEWQKHMGSAGFNFSKVESRDYPYDLPYAALCESMQQEQAVHSYLDWVDAELTSCGKLLKKFGGKWNDFVLPDRVERTITAENYLSGQYRLTLDQSQVLNLLVGEDLYADPAVFVRELIQNAIDAVRTREKLDRDLPLGWKGQINIRTWMDEDGWHWFRIEDNGTGMTEDIIREHLLTVGNSYYTSDAFRKEKLRRHVDEDFVPISRFGIGILSCFMGDKEHNRVEISTKRYKTGDSYPPALRLRMQGLSGYYYMANEAEYHNPGPMIGKDDAEQEAYRTEAGTVVAVRTNLYQSGGYRGFQEIVDRYVLYPPVPIHYTGPEGTKDYLTEAEYMKRVREIADRSEQAEEGEFVFRLSEEQLEEIRKDFPEIVFEKRPGVQLKCVALDRYTPSPYLKGALVVAKPIDWPEIRELTWKGERVVIKKEYITIRGTDNDFQVNIRFDRKKAIISYGALYKKRFVLCKFNQISWLQELFQRVQERISQAGDTNFVWRNLAVHNGIVCSKVSEELKGYISSVLLFCDSYRPVMGMERDRIRQLPVEAMIDYQLIEDQIRQEGYEIADLILTDRTIPNIDWSARQYQELAQKRPDFVERMRIPSEKEVLSSTQWREKRETWLVNLGRYLLTGFRARCDGYLNSFRLSWLQSQCVLRIRLEPDKPSVILATAEQPAHGDTRWLDFPPAFFLPPEREDCPYFTDSRVGSRCSCNANHRLSRFLIDNADKLRKHTLGVFRDIMHSLAEDERDELIQKVNGLLAFLRTMPDSPIPVPTGLELTKEDFCHYDDDNMIGLFSD